MREPDEGTCELLRTRYRLGIAQTAPQQYSTERRRGWVEDETSLARKPTDTWDERREAILVKSQPMGVARLVLEDIGWKSSLRIEGRRPIFSVNRRGAITQLPCVVWADWDKAGRLLVATENGTVEIRDASDLRHRSFASTSTRRGP